MLNEDNYYYLLGETIIHFIQYTKIFFFFLMFINLSSIKFKYFKIVGIINLILRVRIRRVKNILEN